MLLKKKNLIEIVKSKKKIFQKTNQKETKILSFFLAKLIDFISN